MQTKIPRNWKKAFPCSRRDAITTTGMLFCALMLCLVFDLYGAAESCAPMIFVLAVFLTSLLTEGYLWGVVASAFSLVLVNYGFVEPYFAFDFINDGYPVTFITMFVVSILTSTLTARSRAEERLRAENEKERTRANLLRAVSHDIRTPLTAISGAVTTVLEQQETLPQEKQRALLTDAAEESRWLIRLVENLLTVTRIGGENEGLNRQPEAAEEVLAGAAAKFRKRYPGFTVQVSAPEELLMVPMDATLIEQVLLNFLENVALHGEGATQILLSVCKKEKNSIITVQDNGCGISKEAMPHLFEGMCGCMERAQSDDRHNMGLGLSVCRTIVEAHGGHISAENPPEGGAQFSITLPL